MTSELLLSLALIIFADQLTKIFAVRCLTEGQSHLLGFCVYIQRVTNRTHDQRFSSPASVLLLLWAAQFAGIALTHYGHVFSRPAAQFALGAALGNAVSNLHDQLRRGGIVDLIRVGWWPVFNLADAGILLGGIAALWFIR